MSTPDALYAALGPLVGNRVWPEEADENAARPFIVYRLTEQDPIKTINGVIHGCIEQVSIDVWHDKRSLVDALSVQVVEAMRTSGINCTFNGKQWGSDLELGFEGTSLDYTVYRSGV